MNHSTTWTKRLRRATRAVKVGAARLPQRARVVLAFGAVALVVFAAGYANAATKQSASGVSEAHGATTLAAAVAQAKSIVKQYAKAPTNWTAPGPAFDANTSKVRGKKVFWLEISAANPYTTNLLSYWKPVAKLLGLNVTYFDGKGDPSEFVRGINEAIAGHYNVIVNQSGPPSILPDLARAHRDGIKIVDFYIRQNGGKATIPGTTDGDVEYCLTCFGKLIADFAVADSNGHVNAVTMASPDIGITPDYLQGLQGELKRLCPATCKTKVDDVNVADWATKSPTLTSTAVADPTVNYLFALYDSLTLYMIPAVHAAGAQNRVKIVAIDGTSGPMGYLQKHDVMGEDFGESIEGNAYGLGDQIARLLSGRPPVADEGTSIGLRMFTRSNIGSVNLAAPQSAWFGNLDLLTRFSKLWGFSK